MGLSPDGHKDRNHGARNFVSWDGEGITTGDNPQDYVLFGSSTGRYVKGRALSTIACLETILAVEQDDPNAIHVGFAFVYDVEMILHDMPTYIWKRLYSHNVCRWRKYRIEYIPRKYFQVSRKINGKTVCAKIWDLFTFFGTKFTVALERYLGKDNIPELTEIERMKNQRSNFEYDDLEEHIKPYWELELHYLVKLADKLREILYDADIRISQWHGPGAIASYLFMHHRTRKHMKQELPEHILRAAQYAFAAGRFEHFQMGFVPEMHVYDLNSAHPATIAELPSMRGEWKHVINPSIDDVKPYGLYYIVYDNQQKIANNPHLWLAPHPFFYRDKKNCIHFPPTMEGWRWAPEIIAAKEFLQETQAEFTILEGYELQDNGVRPFDFVHEMYSLRLYYKEMMNPIEWAFKLGLNSLFGKMAQKVGWREGRAIPRFHQLEWAGYITSGTRAKLWPALWQAYQQGSLIACETDAVLSSEPLKLPLSKGLGAWGHKKWDKAIYLQNGIYYYHDNKGWHAKFRGLDNDSIPVDSAMRYLESVNLRAEYTTDGSSGYGPLIGTTTRFIGGKQAMHTDISHWRKWRTVPRQIAIGKEGKRIHEPRLCISCINGYTPPSAATHDLRIACEFGAKGYPHIIPWRTSKFDPASWKEEAELLIDLP